MNETQQDIIAKQARIFGTFGIYRYVLACMVVASHSGDVKWVWLGPYAVFAFFVLSAYIACYILHYTYLPLKCGLLKFAANRFLRIYPMYLAVFAIMLWIIILYPNEAKEVHAFQRFPNNFLLWITNLSTMGLVNLAGRLIDPQVLPVGWSLSIEIMFWAVMPILLTKAKIRMVWIIFILLYLSIVYVAYGMSYSWDSLEFRFFSICGSALPFCLGITLFLKKQKSGKIIFPVIGACAIMGFVIMICLAPYLYDDIKFCGFYLMLSINTVIITFLSQIDQRLLPGRLQVCDSRLGDLAYPVYLVHMPIITLFHIFFPLWALHTCPMCVITITVSCLTGFLLHHSIEIPVSRLKKKLKC